MPSSTTTRTYRPRRRRSGDPPPLQLTDRDVEIVREVARYRFVNSDHVTKLIDGSAKNIRNRLKALYEHGYLDRPECQYDIYRPGGGSSPVVYALGDKGARLLMSIDGRQVGLNVAWRAKNRSAGRPFLEHTLAIADFAIGLRVGVQSRPDLELLDMDALIARFPDETRRRSKPLRLSVPVIFNGARHVIGLEPDYAFSIAFPELRQRANYLVEIDRGTMPVERSDLAASSILRKLLAYREVSRASLHTRAFGWRKFTVLLQAGCSERADNIRQCLTRYIGTDHAQLFWVAGSHASERTDPTTVCWTDGGGRTRSIAQF